MPSEQRKPLWLIPNLLSLDAPLVAVAWLYMFAKTWRVDFLPWAAYLSLGLIVWIIYVADRLFDLSMKGGETGRNLEARHEFHRVHEREFRLFVKIAAVVALVLVTAPLKLSLGWVVLRTGLPVSIYGYAAIGGCLVLGFFALSFFSTHGPDDLPYSKNIVAGISFAFGTAMVAHVYTNFDMNEMIFSPELICFAVLCILNICGIDLWEHANRTSDPEAKATDELALTLPLTLLGAAALVFAVKDEEITTRPFFYAVLTGAALLQVLNRTRSRFSMDAVRVLADGALLVPFLVFVASSKP